MSTNIQKETVTTNRFLKDVETWEETEVKGYKAKVRFELAEAWVDTLWMFILMFTVLGIVWAFIITLVFGLFSSDNHTAEIVLVVSSLILYAVLAFIVARKRSTKNVRKFVVTNRGEVGHYGQPFYKKVTFMTWFSLVFAIGVWVAAWFLVIKSPDNINVETVSNIQPFLFSSLYPFFYYLGAKHELNYSGGATCPICGRFHSMEYESSSTYGKEAQGVRHQVVRQNRKVGENQTVAHYSDGSTRVVSSTPIYANVVVDEYDEEYGTVMYDYLKYCQYCSYVERGTNLKGYTSRLQGRR